MTMFTETLGPVEPLPEMFKTPLPFTIPSFLVGMSMAFDLGSTLQAYRFDTYFSEPYTSDMYALASDFAVIGDDIAEAVEACAEKQEAA